MRFFVTWLLTVCMGLGVVLVLALVAGLLSSWLGWVVFVVGAGWWGLTATGYAKARNYGRR